MRKIQIFNILLVIVAGLAVTSILAVQTGRQLFLVTGMRTHNTDSAISSTVFAVNEAGRSLSKVADLADSEDGSNFILADHDRRVLVVGTPHDRASEIVVLRMDSPASPYRIPVSVGLGLETLLVDKPGGGIALALRTGTVGSWALTGVDLNAPDAKQLDLAWTDYRNIRREGYWAPGDMPGGYVGLTVSNGHLIANRGGGSVDTGIAVPKKMADETDQEFQMDANNDQILVVDRPKERGNGLSGPAGKTRVAILDKASGTWRDENFDGGGSSVRAFGPWVIVNESDFKVDLSKGAVERDASKERQSPGQAQRDKVLNPRAAARAQITVDGVFAASPYYFPGSVSIHNAKTGKRYKLTTNQGDTEVLLIDGTTVYYRVNDSLFRGQIGQNSVENSVEMLRDPNVPSAHWAFLGR